MGGTWSKTPPLWEGKLVSCNMGSCLRVKKKDSQHRFPEAQNELWVQSNTVTCFKFSFPCFISPGIPKFSGKCG